MGLLKDLGEVYTYEQSIQYQMRLQKMAALQFLHIFGKYHAWKNPLDQAIRWGDQVEGHRLRKTVQGEFELELSPLPKLAFPLTLEYGSWMFEMTPQHPHTTRWNSLEVVSSFRERYSQLNEMNCLFLTIPAIPFLGATTSPKQFRNEITKSQFLGDELIADHQRFITLTRNIRERRGRKVEILVPVFRDQKTDLEGVTAHEPVAGNIYMDAMAFGMGLACLQCTFGTKNISHARYLHDQLHVFSPLFLALTAGTPIHKGRLSDWDVRWKIIEQSVDDRILQQLDPHNAKFQPKSRYSSMSYYISDSAMNFPSYSDQYYKINHQVVALLQKQSQTRNLPLDDRLINHIASLTSRDFLVMYKKFLEVDEENEYLFEMVNSTNWNSVRFKAPLDEHMGWRVEFRTMEVQLTPDENAAFSLLVYMIVRLLNEQPTLNFYLPISKVNLNFQRAHQQNAILKQKFFFRINIHDAGEPVVQQLSLKEIFLGSEKSDFKGLFHEFNSILDDPEYEPDEISITLQNLRNFIQNLVEGKRLTLAQWMREFVRGHKNYNQDSVVSQPIIHDLLQTLLKITSGELKEGNFQQIFKL